MTAWSALAATSSEEPPAMIDPATAVMGMLTVSWLRVHLYAGLLERQVQRDGGATPAGAGAEISDAEHAGGLVGWKYDAAGKDGVIYAQSEAARALVTLEAQERDRCVKYAKTAHDMGIADREIALAERQTQLVAVAFGRALDAVGLDVARREQAAQVLITELRVLTEAA